MECARGSSESFTRYLCLGSMGIEAHLLALEWKICSNSLHIWPQRTNSIAWEHIQSIETRKVAQNAYWIQRTVQMSYRPQLQIPRTRLIPTL